MRDIILSEIKPKDILRYYGIEEKRDKYLCPFHADTHPSMSIKGDLIRCWVCMEKAINVIDFVMQYENLDFGKSIDKICDMFGISNNAKNVPKIKNYNKDIQTINNRINFLENVKKFGFGTEFEAQKEIIKLENERASILVNNPDFVEREFEKVRKNVDSNYRKTFKLDR